MALTASNACVHFDIEIEDQRTSESRNPKPCAIFYAFVLGMMVATIGLLTVQYHGLGDDMLLKFFSVPTLSRARPASGAIGTSVGVQGSKNKVLNFGRASPPSIHQHIPPIRSQQISISLPVVSSVLPVHSLKASADMEGPPRTDELDGSRSSNKAAVSGVQLQSSPWSLITFLSFASVLLMIIIGGFILLQQRPQSSGIGHMGRCEELMVPGVSLLQPAAQFAIHARPSIHARPAVRLRSAVMLEGFQSVAEGPLPDSEGPSASEEHTDTPEPGSDSEEFGSDSEEYTDTPEPGSDSEESGSDSEGSMPDYSVIDKYLADYGDEDLSCSENHRAGFVSILGVPNVGKSTLMNNLLGEKLSIITNKAQTTRHRIMGILNSDDYQIVYSDTPGVLLPQYKLQEGMMRFVKGAINDGDVLVLVVDVFQDGFPDETILRSLKQSSAALLVLLNKIDLLAEGSSLKPDQRAALGTEEELLQRWREEFPGASVLPISAREQMNLDVVLERLLALMPLHPPYFDKEQLSDMPDRFFAAEILRESIFELFSQEVPYSCEVAVTSFKEDKDVNRISCEIYVAQESQKGILIGAQGKAIKRLGIRARKGMESFFQKRVNLKTNVKVRKSWRQDEKSLREFGYLA